MKKNKILLFMFIILMLCLTCCDDSGSVTNNLNYDGIKSNQQLFIKKNMNISTSKNKMQMPKSIKLIVDVTNSMKGFSTGPKDVDSLTERQEKSSKLKNIIADICANIGKFDKKGIALEYYLLGKIKKDADTKISKVDRFDIMNILEKYYNDERIDAYKSARVNFYDEIKNNKQNDDIVIFITDAQFDTSDSYSETSCLDNIIHITVCESLFCGSIDYVPISEGRKNKISAYYEDVKPLFIMTIAEKPMVEFFLSEMKNEIEELSELPSLSFYVEKREEDLSSSLFTFYKGLFVFSKYYKLDNNLKFKYYNDATKYLMINSNNIDGKKINGLDFDLLIRNDKIKSVTNVDVDISINEFDISSNSWIDCDECSFDEPKILNINDFILDKLKIIKDSNGIDISNLRDFDINLIKDFFVSEVDSLEPFYKRDPIQIEALDYSSFSKNRILLNLKLKDLKVDKPKMVKIDIKTKKHQLPSWVENFNTENENDEQMTKVWNLKKFINNLSKNIEEDNKIISTVLLYLDTNFVPIVGQN